MSVTQSVQGKTAIVTGAGSGKLSQLCVVAKRKKVHRAYFLFYLVKGINLAFATLLLANGCNVLIADLALRPEAKVIVDKHSSRSGSARAVFQKTNVIDWKQLEEMFTVAEREFGEVDIVCPGAGVYEEVRLCRGYLRRG
jgi:NAD(P)-dependent dehydrogenase (short-subunit alcohol dehydrogenase family)